MNDGVPHWGKREGGTDAEMYRQAMDSLGKLKGVGPATAPAIVASWTDVGIFQSDESDELAEVLMGKVMIEYTWPFYWRFYKEATGVLEKLKKKSKGLVKSGKDMERLAWSMYHSQTAEVRAEEEQTEVGPEEEQEEQQAEDEEEQVEDEVQEQEQVPIVVAQQEAAPEVTPKKAAGRKRKAVSTDSPAPAKKTGRKSKAISIDLSGQQEDDVGTASLCIALIIADR